MKAWLTGPDTADFDEAARLLRIAGYEASSPLDLPAGISGNLRAELRWLSDGVLNADVVVVLPGWDAADLSRSVELTLADAIDTPVVELDSALAREPERLLA